MEAVFEASIRARSRQGRGWGGREGVYSVCCFETAFIHTALAPFLFCVSFRSTRLGLKTVDLVGGLKCCTDGGGVGWAFSTSLSAQSAPTRFVSTPSRGTIPVKACNFVPQLFERKSVLELIRLSFFPSARSDVPIVLCGAPVSGPVSQARRLTGLLSKVAFRWPLVCTGSSLPQADARGAVSTGVSCAGVRRDG